MTTSTEFKSSFEIVKNKHTKLRNSIVNTIVRIAKAHPDAVIYSFGHNQEITKASFISFSDIECCEVLGEFENYVTKNVNQLSLKI